MTIMVWFRGDLRVHDNPALSAAMSRSSGRGSRGKGLKAVFFSTPGQWRKHDWGPPRVAFTLGCCRALSDSLAKLGIKLDVEVVPDDTGLPEAIKRVVRDADITELHFNREFGLNEDRRDRAVEDALKDQDVRTCLHEDQTMVPVRDIRTGEDRPYSVYSPFRKRWLERYREHGCHTLDVPSSIGKAARPGEVPSRIEGFDAWDGSQHWPSGEEEGQRRLRKFLDQHVDRYKQDRDRPDLDGTSTLSPWLASGALSARTCLHELTERFGEDPDKWDAGPQTWLNELIWRDFYRHVMNGFPRLNMRRPLIAWTENVSWREDDEGFTAWCKGQTGVPMVDAGMRQLAETGWMHNRLRMLTATFLTKHLLIDWRKGERHFANSLVDYDFASNNGGWQWAASTGTDAAPYFRVLSPDRQAQRFDPDDAYVTKWVPEVGSMSYPDPIVDLKKARTRAIDAFKRAKGQ